MHYPRANTLSDWIFLCWSHGLSARRAQRTKSRGPKGLLLEVGARRAPRLLVIYKIHRLIHDVNDSICWIFRSVVNWGEARLVREIVATTSKVPLSHLHLIQPIHPSTIHKIYSNNLFAQLIKINLPHRFKSIHRVHWEWLPSPPLRSSPSWPAWRKPRGPAAQGSWEEWTRLGDHGEWMWLWEWGTAGQGKEIFTPVSDHGKWNERDLAMGATGHCCLHICHILLELVCGCFGRGKKSGHGCYIRGVQFSNSE